MLKLFWCAVVALSVMTTVVSAQDESDEVTQITSVAWSPDGDKIATATNTGRLYVWDVATDSLLHEFQAHEGAVYGISWNFDATRLATSNNIDKVTRIWDAETGHMVAELPISHYYEYSAFDAWHPREPILVTIAAASDGGAPFQVWQIEDDDIQQLPTTHYTDTYGIEWSPDGSRLAVARFIGIHIFDDFFDTSSILRAVAPFHIRMAWSPDGTKLVAAEFQTGVVNTIDVDTGETLLSVQGADERIASVAWSPDGMIIIADNFNGTVQIWDAITGEPVQTLSPERQGGLMSLSPYGGRLAYGQAFDSDSEETPFQIVVPAPSFDRLAAITALCVRDGDARAESLTDSVPTMLDDLPAFVAQVEALPDGAIPPACKADLLAVASALGD